MDKQGREYMRNERLPAEERKWQIRYCAKDVFLRKGFHNTTMEDVISESGLSKGGVYRYYKSTTDMLYDLMEDGCVYRYNIVDNFLTANKNLDKYDIVSEMIVDKILDDKEMKKRFFKKYGYEMKDDEDFLSPSEVKKRKDIINEMLREGVRNPKNYMTDKVTNELNKIGNEWKFKDAEKFEEMLKKI